MVAQRALAQSNQQSNSRLWGIRPATHCAHGLDEGLVHAPHPLHLPPRHSLPNQTHLRTQSLIDRRAQHQAHPPEKLPNFSRTAQHAGLIPRGRGTASSKGSQKFCTRHEHFSQSRIVPKSFSVNLCRSMRANFFLRNYRQISSLR